MVRKIAASISLCSLLFAGAGCASSDSVHSFYPHSRVDTLTLSGKDHHHRVTQILRHDRQSLIDDLDSFFLVDRPMNRWHSK